jgi:hypothetical protein
MDTPLIIGSRIIIDGLVWTIESFRGAAARATHEEQPGKAIWFSAAEAQRLSAGLWALPGRMEPPTVNPAASVVASVAAASVTLNG